MMQLKVSRFAAFKCQEWHPIFFIFFSILVKVSS